MVKKNKSGPHLNIDHQRVFLACNIILGVNLILFSKTVVKADTNNTAQDMLNQNANLVIVDTKASTSVNPLAVVATSGEWGTCQWDINADGQLTIHAGRLRDLQPNWIDSASLIKSVYVEPGVVAGSDAQNLFYNLINAETIDVTNLDVSQTKGFANMFYNTSSLKQIIGMDNWDTSEALNMNGMFMNTLKLENLDVSNFNTEKVTSMSGMFHITNPGTSTLTKITGLNHFNTQNVTDMGMMFSGQNKLTELDVSNFDTKKVEKMQNMFEKTMALKKLDVSNFVTDNVEKVDYMFAYCKADITGLKNFNMSKVQEFNSMFTYSNLIDIKELENWDTSNATSFSSMFANCRSLQSIDVSKWNTQNVTDIGSMFYFDDSLADLKGFQNWSTSKVTNMSNFLQRTRMTEIKQIEHWDTSNVTSMAGLFYGCTLLEQLDLSNWNTSKVQNMSSMFGYLLAMPDDKFIQNMDTSNVTNMSSMFVNDDFSVLDLSNFNTSKVTDMNAMFSSNNKQSLKIIGNFDTSKVKLMSNMFANSLEMDFSEFNIKDWNLSSLTDIGSMFARSDFTNVDFINNWDVSNVKTFNNMFDGSKKLQTLDFSNWDTTNSQSYTSFFSSNSCLWQVTFGPNFVFNNLPTTLSMPSVSAGTEIIDPSAPGFTAISDQWQEVDQVQGGTVHQPVGKLFSSHAVLQNHTQVNQAARTYVWQQQEYREFSMEVPNIDFGTISGFAGVYQRKSDGPVVISKYSYPTSKVDYKLLLSMEQPLQTEDGAHQLPGTLIFRDQNNNDTSLSDSEQIIHTGTIGTKDENLTWAKNQGILLKLNGDVPVNGQYHATLKWTLSDSV